MSLRLLGKQTLEVRPEEDWKDLTGRAVSDH